MKIFSIALCLTLLTSSAFSLRIACNYQTIYFGYTCVISGLFDSSSDDFTVTHVSGQHLPENTNNQVKAVDGRYKSFRRFPLNLSKFFPNLDSILIEKGLTEIHKEELAQYPNLKRLYLSGNELEVIEPNLFTKNRKLELIFLNANKIKSVAYNVFDGLDKLTYLGFDKNVCYSGIVENNLEGSKELAKDIYKNCSPLVPTGSSFGSESCVPKKDFEDFRLELKEDIGELTEKLQKWREETVNFVKLVKESCATD